MNAADTTLTAAPAVRARSRLPAAMWALLGIAALSLDALEETHRRRGLLQIAQPITHRPQRIGVAWLALGDGRHKLPVKLDLREALGKQPGDDVTVHLQERL